MFAESLLEVSPAQRLRKGWLTVSSITLQAILVVSLLTLPLLKPEGLPFLKSLGTPVIWSGAPPVNMLQQQAGFVPTQAGRHVIMLSGVLRFGPTQSRNSEGADSPACVICTGQHTIGSGGPADFLIPSVNSMPIPPPPKPNPAPPVRISHWMEGNLISRVQPQYPMIARNAGIQGQVVLQAVVSRDGAIENLKLVSGHPLLVRSAIEAVSRWRYRPYYLNGEPIEVETQITVNFLLNGAS